MPLMPTLPITPARIDWSSEPDQTGQVPRSPLYDDVYHAQAGAWAQARHVFLQGNDLPARWQTRPRFVILETGFGLGNNFLATWASWLADVCRCQRLVFISIEKHPPALDDLRRAHQGRARDEDFDVAQGLAERLCQAWPPLTAGLHVLDFDEASSAGVGAPAGVTLILGLGDVKDLLPKLQASVDAFFLDGFAPAKNPAMWDEHLLSRLNRLAGPQATAATWSVARGVREALGKAGFVVSKAPGFSSKRDMLRAHFAPHHTPPPLAGGLWPSPAHDHHAVVIGAGLAGCAAAWALTMEGWHVTVVEQHSHPAQEASGNLGGLFHSIVHGHDNIHTRAHRAAALLTARVVGPWIREGRIPGQIDGLLRLDDRLSNEQAQAILAAQGCPSDYLTWLPHVQAQAFSGLPLPSGAWLFKQGGWLHPAAYAQALLDAARQTGLLTWQGSQRVSGLARPDSEGPWQVLGDAGQVLSTAPCVVLCNARQAMALPLGSHGAAELPLVSIRGQVSCIDANLPGLTQPRHPVAGNGYALRLPDGRVLCGATTQEGDDDLLVRWQDHQHNLAQASRLGVLNAISLAELGTAHLQGYTQGRTAWRASTPDRLPLVGALADTPPTGAKAWPDQVRRVPRLRDPHGGLYVMSGLGSRGITWAALCARLLSHWVTGAPCPIEADLRDALDPARFGVRQQRLKSSNG